MNAPVKPVRMAGFTLIEVIAFIVIIAIAVTGFASVFRQVLRGSHVPVVGAQAVLLAQEKIEEIHADRMINGFDTITDTAYATPESIDIDGDGNADFKRFVTVQKGTYSGTDISCGTYAADAEYLCITVTVTGPTVAVLNDTTPVEGVAKALLADFPIEGS